MSQRFQCKASATPWFAIRKELSGRRRSLLIAASFLLPILIWSVVSYTPFIWHPDIKLEISADRENVTTVFTAGNHLSKGFYPGFVAAVLAENEAIRAERVSGESSASGFSARRANLKILRHMAPVALANGWLTRQEAEQDVRLYDVWKGVAEGALSGKKTQLSAANIAVVQRNWSLLEAHSPVFDSKLLPEQPLEKLIPQGRPANPVYLPAPHEVVIQGYHDFTRETDPGKPSMWQRYKHSLRIVFFGFLISALIGLPIGILCGTFDFFSKLFEPFIDFFRYMPAPAFSTLLVAVFMAHDAPKIALVFLGTFFQMVLVVANTTRQLDASLIEAAQTLGARTFTMIRRVIIPGITLNLYNDMRILLGWAWTWLVIAELIGVKSGLTEFIETQGRWRNFDSVFPVIILIGLTGFVTDQILASLRKYFFPWTPESAEKKHGLIGRFVLWMLDRKVYLAPANGKANG